MDIGSANTRQLRSHKGKNKKSVRCDDPELAAEMRYAKENGMVVPTTLASSPVETKVTTHTATVLRDIKKVAPNQTKKSKKARNRGVSGCSIKKDGGRFELGFEDAYLSDDDGDEPECDAEMVEDPEVMKWMESSVSVTERFDNMYEIGSAVVDYYQTGDMDRVIDSVQKYATNKDYMVFLVGEVMREHLRGDASWGQLATDLLNHLKETDLISSFTVHTAIKRILDRFDDLVIEHPHALQSLSQLFARVLDDQLIKRADFWVLSEKCYGTMARQCCENVLNYVDNHASMADMPPIPASPASLVKTPSDDNLPVELLSKQLKLLLKEYIVSNDIDEAVQRVLQLNARHYNHELVYFAGEMAMEKMDGPVMDQLAEFLKSMLDTGHLQESCVVIGFKRLYAALPSIRIDLPAAYALAAMWTKKCLGIGLINSDIAEECPIQSRSRILSESPDGKLVCMDADSVDSGFSGSISEG